MARKIRRTTDVGELVDLVNKMETSYEVEESTAAIILLTYYTLLQNNKLARVANILKRIERKLS